MANFNPNKKRRDWKRVHVLVRLHFKRFLKLSKRHNDQYTALHYAAKYGWTTVMAAILKNDSTLIDRFFTNSLGRHLTALHVAAIWSRYSAIKLLISFKASLQIDPAYLLYLTVKNPKAKYLRLVIKAGINVNAEDSSLIGDSNLLLYLVEKAIPLNKKTYEQKLRCVVINGGEMSATNGFLYTPLHTALLADNIIAIRVMLNEISVDELRLINSMDFYRNYRPVRNSWEEIECFMWNQFARNIFSLAIYMNSLEVVQLVLPLLYDDERFKVCDPPRSFCLPHMVLNYSKPAECSFILERLFQLGFDFNLCAFRIRNVDPRIRGDLKEWIAITSWRDFQFSPRFSVLGCAVFRKMPGVVKWLIEHGAHIEPIGANIIPPVVIAVWNKDNYMYHLLKFYNAVDRMELIQLLECHQMRLREAAERRAGTRKTIEKKFKEYLV